MDVAVKNKKLENGFSLPELWIWTWPMWGYRERDINNDNKRDIEAIKYAIKSWITHIDTAELYANWYSEKLLSKAIKDFDRKKLIIASKVNEPINEKAEYILCRFWFYNLYIF